MADRESAFARRRRLYALIKAGELGQKVIADLVPQGEAHLYERALWDYKSELPTRPRALSHDAYNVEMAEIVKDAVSFYNAYGGYIVAGVRDDPREVVGYSEQFDCDELNRRIRAVTRHHVECHFALVECPGVPTPTTIGLLHIPQRPEGKEPAQFTRDAPPKSDGRRAYRVRDIYFRQADECKPAQLSEDYAFLCGQGRRQFVDTGDIGLTSVLDNNLGARDAGFIRFIGREEYLHDLWRWLCDRFMPVKLLAAHGGVGKTTIARAFAEMVLQSSPLGFERVIWLSAKPRQFVALSNAYVSRGRADFTDTASLLYALLSELGTPEASLDRDLTREEIEEELIAALEIIPAFLVVDDLDSLAAAEQQDAFHTILRIIGQSSRSARVPSRAVLTARLDLGAAPGQLIHVQGMTYTEFDEYVRMIAASIGLPWSFNASSPPLRKFHRSTEGSPIFAASVLRLLQLGDTLNSALERWQGAAGEEVRQFTFKKELDQLSESQVRTLFAACILQETSTVELQHITQSSEVLLRDDLGELRKYHLLSLESDVPRGGARLVVPSGIRLMTSLIRERVRDPNRIERECATLRAGSAKLGMDVGRIVNRVIALWKENRAAEALEVAEWGDRQAKRHPDLKCLLGRAYLRLDPPDARRSELTFRAAHELKCRRPELFGFWIEAKKLLRDWVGIVEITRLAEDELGPSAEYLLLRAEAMNSLAEIALEAGHLQVAADNYLKAGREIDDAFKKDKARGRVSDLNEMRSLMFQNYVYLIDRLTPLSDEHIEVWRAMLNAFYGYVRRPFVIRLGVSRLASWWLAVERRGGIDKVAADLMDAQLETLRDMISTLERQERRDDELIKWLRDERLRLSTRISEYRAG